MPNNNLYVELSDPTVYDTQELWKTKSVRHLLEEILEIPVKKNKKHEESKEVIRMIGDFSDFQLYLFTLSKKIHIIENSIHRLTHSFSAKIKYYDENDMERTMDITFSYPLKVLPDDIVKIETISSEKDIAHDTFRFVLKDGKTESHTCDIDFISNFGENISQNIPIKVVYVGVVEKSTSEARERIRKGHHRLEELQAKYDSKAYEISLILYRISRLGNNKLNLKDLHNTVEYSAISYFQPEYNKEGKNFPESPKTVVNALLTADVNGLFLTLSSPKNVNFFTEACQVAPNYIGIAMPIAKDEERRAQFADFLCNIVEKYNIPITEADS